jgi:hypothetical protein
VHVVALFAIVTAITSLRQLRRTVPAATLQPY